MPYRLLADLVVLVHFGFIAFAVCGGLLALRWRWIPWVHLPAAAWGALVEFAGWTCPLTPLENALYRRAGSDGYAGDFIGHYLLPLIYPSGLTREIQLGLGLVVIVVNLLIYRAVWNRRCEQSGKARTRG